MSFEFEQDSFCLSLLTPSSEQFTIELDTIELPLQALDCGGAPCSALTNKVREKSLGDVKAVVGIVVVGVDVSCVNQFQKKAILFNAPALFLSPHKHGWIYELLHWFVLRVCMCFEVSVQECQPVAQTVSCL